MDYEPEYGELRWEAVDVEVDRDDASFDVTIRLREPRAHPWPTVFVRLAEREHPADAGWDSIAASMSEVTVYRVQAGSEERLRNFVERMVPVADDAATRLEIAASDMTENFRKLAGFPPRG